MHVNRSSNGNGNGNGNSNSNSNSDGNSNSITNSNSINGNKKYRAALFDLDGTLLDTVEDLTDSLNKTLKLMDLPGYSIDVVKQMLGSGTRKLVTRALNLTPADSNYGNNSSDSSSNNSNNSNSSSNSSNSSNSNSGNSGGNTANNNEAAIDRLLKLYKKDYESHWAVKTRPFEGIPELLLELSQKGIILTVLSNKMDNIVKLMISHFFPQFSFGAVMGDHPPMPVKPDPTSALQIASTLGIPAEDFIYIGDSDVDMHTANNAGMLAVGAAWGYRSKQVLEESGAAIIINHPLELLKLLK